MDQVITTVIASTIGAIGTIIAAVITTRGSGRNDRADRLSSKSIPPSREPYRPTSGVNEPPGVSRIVAVVVAVAYFAFISIFASQNSSELITFRFLTIEIKTVLNIFLVLAFVLGAVGWSLIAAGFRKRVR